MPSIRLTGYPTIYYFKNGKKGDPSVYSEAIEEEQLIKFVSDNYK
jgi:hypothetical protein